MYALWGIQGRKSLLYPEIMHEDSSATEIYLEFFLNITFILKCHCYVMKGPISMSMSVGRWLGSTAHLHALYSYQVYPLLIKILLSPAPNTMGADQYG